MNLNVNILARMNAGRVGNELRKLSNSVKAAHSDIAVAAAKSNASISTMNKSMAGAAGAAAGFQSQFVQMAQPVDTLANSVRKGDLSVRQFSQAIRNNAAITKQQIAMQRGHVEMMRNTSSGMAEVEFRTRNLNDVTTKWTQHAGYAAASMKGLSNRVINAGKNMQWAGRQIMVGITVPLGFLAFRATKAAEEYDRAMTKVIKVTNFAAQQGTEAFAREEAALRAQIRNLAELGTQMGFTSVETAEAAAEFSQMGYQAAALDQLVEASQKLAYTSGTEMKDALNLTRITAQAFDIELGNLTQTFARLNMIENNTALSLDEMAQSLPTVAAVAHNLGLEVEETAGLMAMMKDAGIDATEGATALRTGLIRIVQEASDPAIEAFENIGLSLTDLQARHKGDTLGFFDELGQHLQGLNDAAARADFTAAIGKLTGTRQAARFLTFLEEVPNRMIEGTAGFRAWSGASADSAEAMATFNFEMQQVADSAAGTADRLRAEISTALEEMGHPMLQFMNTLREFAVTILNWFNNLGEGTKRAIRTIITIGAIAGPIIMLVGILGNLFGQFTRAISGLIVFATRTRFLTNEQAALNAVLNNGWVNTEAYNNALTRTAVLQQRVAASATTMATGLTAANARTGAVGAFAQTPGGIHIPYNTANQARTNRGTPNAVPGAGAGGPVDRDAAVRGNRVSGAAAAIGGVAGLTLISSLIKDITSGTADWGSALMKVTGAAMLIGPVIGRAVAMTKALKLATGGAALGMSGFGKVALGVVGGPLGAIAAAVAAIGYGIFKWKRDGREAFDAIPRAADEAEMMAKHLGMAWSKSEGLDDSMKSATQLAAEARKEQAGLIAELKNATDDERAQRVHEIGMQMVWAGNDPKEVQEQLKTWLTELNLKVPVELETSGFLGDEGRLRAEMAKLGNDLSVELNKGWLAGLRSNEDGVVREMATLIGDAVNRGGEMGANAAGVYWQEAINKIMDIEDMSERHTQLQNLRQELEEIVGIDLTQINRADYWKHMNGPGSLQRLDIQAYEADLLSLETLFSDAVENGAITQHEYRNMSLGVAGETAQSLKKMLGALRTELRALQAVDLTSTLRGLGPAAMEQASQAHEKKIRALQDAIENLGGEIDGLESRSKGGADGLDELGESAEGAAQDVMTAQDAVSALRSAMGEVMGRIATIASEQLDEQFKAEDEMWDKRAERLQEVQDAEIEATRKAQEEQLEATRNRFDSEIEALQEVEEQEDELARQRAHHFRMQKLRDDYLNRRAQHGIDITSAIARGDLDEAARIRQTQGAEHADFLREQAEEEQGYAEDTRKRLRDETIKSYEEQRDAAVEALETEQAAHMELVEASHKARTKQVEQARDASKKQQEITKKQLDHQLEQWKNTTPRTEQEYQDHLARLGEIMSQFGIKDLTSIASSYESIFDGSIFNGFKSGVDAATKALVEDNRWRSAGEVIGEEIINGILGIESDAAAGSKRIGTADAWERHATAARNRSVPTGVGTGGVKAFHSGGIVNRSTAGPGLKPGEHNTVLQTGEYVMDRKTVDRYGPEFFRGLQRFHEGGLVDHIGDTAPLAAMSNILGQVLGGTPIEQTGQIGKAISTAMGRVQIPEGAGQFTPGQGNYPPRRRGVISSNTAAALQFVKSNWQLPNGVGVGLDRADNSSDHGWGKALDIMVARLGKFPSEQQRLQGWQIANWFVQNAGAFGTKYVIWDKMINSGGGWRPYTRYGANPGATLGHYDHVHTSFLHSGGLVGTDGARMTIPALKTGARVNYDNTLANLHKGETVLTAPLTQQLYEGIGRLAAGGKNEYNVTIEIRGDVNERNAKSLAKQVRREIETLENRTGPNRRMG